MTKYKHKSNKKAKIVKAICTAGIVTTLLPVPAFAGEQEIIERNQIEVNTDITLGYNPFYEPTEEDLIFDISALQKSDDSYLEFQKEISYEEYKKIIANTEDIITFAENGMIIEINKQEFQDAVEKAIDNYNESDKYLGARITLGIYEGICVIMLGGCVIAVITGVTTLYKYAQELKLC